MQSNSLTKNDKVRWHNLRATAMVLAQGTARSRTAPGVFELKPYVWRGTTNSAALPILRAVHEADRKKAAITSRNRAAGAAKARAAKTTRAS